ncbi:MAG: prephenate dehydratase [Xanthomonadales bacterium]|nr:prephenate dehydratase [Xanthomonadales bacterium]
MGKQNDKTKSSTDPVSELRGRIDDLDRQIQELISSRATVARQMREAKGELVSTVDYYRPEREAQVLRGVVERNEGPLSDGEMVRLFREIMSACLAQQEPLKIAYLGPEGTFSQSASIHHFGQSIKGLPLNTIEEVFAEVEAADADFGVVPVENSTEGAVSNTLDMFIASPLKICGEVELRIHQHLLSKATTLEHVERVYSHRQSLAQCRGWLHQHLPHAERIPVASNAEAARRVRYAEDAAAIAGEAAAEVYGLNTLFANIEDRPDNSTRFLVIGRKLLAPSGHDKTSLLVSSQDRPGLLYHLLDPLAQAGVSMTRIESRPSRQGKWDYVFFIDVAGHSEEEPLAGALRMLKREASLFKILGSYPVASV